MSVVSFATRSTCPFQFECIMHVSRKQFSKQIFTLNDGTKWFSQLQVKQLYSATVSSKFNVRSYNGYVTCQTRLPAIWLHWHFAQTINLKTNINELSCLIRYPKDRDKVKGWRAAWTWVPGIQASMFPYHFIANIACDTSGPILELMVLLLNAPCSTQVINIYNRQAYGSVYKIDWSNGHHATMGRPKAFTNVKS